MFAKVSDWFTAARRKAIYAAAGSVTPVLVLAGLISQEQSVQILAAVSLLLTAGASLLAIFNLTPDAPSEPEQM